MVKNNTSPQIETVAISNDRSSQFPDADSLVASADTASVVKSSPPPKKLRVVHINELGSPVIERIRLVQAAGNLQNKSKEDRTSDFFSNNTDDNIFKIKLSPHN